MPTSGIAAGRPGHGPIRRRRPGPGADRHSGQVDHRRHHQHLAAHRQACGCPPTARTDRRSGPTVGRARTGRAGWPSAGNRSAPDGSARSGGTRQRSPPVRSAVGRSEISTAPVRVDPVLVTDSTHPARPCPGRSGTARPGATRSAGPVETIRRASRSAAARWRRSRPAAGRVRRAPARRPRRQCRRPAGSGPWWSARAIPDGPPAPAAEPLPRPGPGRRFARPGLPQRPDAPP